MRSKFLRKIYGLLMVSLPKIDVSVNAPAAGTIKELLVNEEDTVEVGQDLLRLELGGAPEGGSKPTTAAKEEPKAPAETPKAEEKVEKKEEKVEEKRPEAPKKESEPAPKQEAPKAQSSAPASTDGLGHREERRVSIFDVHQFVHPDSVIGQNEPHAPPYC